MKICFFILLAAFVVAAGCIMDCGGINAGYSGLLENAANYHEHVYLSNADLFLSGTFSVDTHYSLNGSVFGTSGDTIRGKYHWQGDNLTLISDKGDRYVFTKNSAGSAEMILILGFGNSKDPVNQFSYLHAIPQC